MARTISLDRYRNIGLLANRDAGRTTTTERLLAAARRAEEGARAAGADLPGWIEQDNDRDITLTSAATSCFWQGCRINIVELSAARGAGFEGLLAVLDGTVVVLDGVAGLTTDVEAVLASAEKAGIARLLFVNKLDDAGVALDGLLGDLASRGGATPLLLQLPIGPGLQGLVDLVEMQATSWPAGYAAAAETGPIPAEHQAAAEAARKALLSGLGIADASIGVEALRQAVRAAVLAGRVLPVLCGSAFRNRGVEELLDAVTAYLPAPSDLAVLNGRATDGLPVERRQADEESFTGVAFRTVEDPTAGTLTFVRIFSGVVATGSQMLNSVSTNPERIGRMVRMHANHAEDIEEARAGDIVALAGLEHTTTGDTLCDPSAPVILGPVPASAGRVKH
jgi:elongation factor G